jgi:hypothetical protein
VTPQAVGEIMSAGPGVSQAFVSALATTADVWVANPLM